MSVFFTFGRTSVLFACAKRNEAKKNTPPVSFAPVCLLFTKLKIISNKQSNTFMIFGRFAQRAKV